MKRNKKYAVETIAGQQVLLPSSQEVIDGGMVFHLNETASWILCQLDQETELETLLTQAAVRFQAESPEERETLRLDIIAFLDQLRDLGLLEE